MKNLEAIPGTVAYVMNQRASEINFAGSLQGAKTAMINILSSPEIKQQDLAKKYIFEIGKITNMSHLMSTFTTYLTGTKVVSAKNRAKRAS